MANDADSFPDNGSEWADGDADGVGDNGDNCVSVSNPRQENSDDDAMGNACDADDDNDGLVDSSDNCPTSQNPNQEDLDQDGRGDACDDDIDGDWSNNDQDAFPLDATEWRDSDADGIGDNQDNCDFYPNADQADQDADGRGDPCDSRDNLDSDGDGVENWEDRFPNDPNYARDDDGDGVPNERDTCPRHHGGDPSAGDRDGDGVADLCDEDRDGDGVPNYADAYPDNPARSGEDRDGDGTEDAVDNCKPAYRVDETYQGRHMVTDNIRPAYNPDQRDVDGDGVGDGCEDRNDRNYQGEVYYTDAWEDHMWPNCDTSRYGYDWCDGPGAMGQAAALEYLAPAFNQLNMHVWMNDEGTFSPQPTWCGTSSNLGSVVGEWDARVRQALSLGAQASFVHLFFAFNSCLAQHDLYGFSATDDAGRQIGRVYVDHYYDHDHTDHNSGADWYELPYLPATTIHEMIHVLGGDHYVDAEDKFNRYIGVWRMKDHDSSATKTVTRSDTLAPETRVQLRCAGTYPCPDGQNDWPLYGSTSRYYAADYAAPNNADIIDLPNRARLVQFSDEDMWRYET